MHYHLFMGAVNTPPMATVQIDDYDESIRKFLRLARSVYGGSPYFRSGLDYQNLLQVSDFGDAAHPMTIGTDALAVQWYPCSYPCMSPSWN